MKRKRTLQGLKPLYSLNESIQLKQRTQPYIYRAQSLNSFTYNRFSFLGLMPAIMSFTTRQNGRKN